MATTPDRDAVIAEQYDTAWDTEHGAQLITAGTIADRVDDAITAKLREWRDQAAGLDGIV